MHKTKSYLHFVSCPELPIAHPTLQPREKLQKLHSRSSCKWTYSRGFFDVIHVILTTRSHDKWLRSVAAEYLMLLIKLQSSIEWHSRPNVSTAKCLWHTNRNVYHNNTSAFSKMTSSLRYISGRPALWNHASNDTLDQSVEDAWSWIHLFSLLLGPVAQKILITF